MNDKKPITVEEYLNQFQDLVYHRLVTIREMITTHFPDAVESISYGMPAYKLNKKPLVYFAGYEKHIGIYATPGAQAKMQTELKGFKQGKGSVQFPNDNDLPLSLILQLIQVRATEIMDK